MSFMAVVKHSISLMWAKENNNSHDELIAWNDFMGFESLKLNYFISMSFKTVHILSNY